VRRVELRASFRHRRRDTRHSALIRKTAVRHDSCRNKFRCAARDDFRPGSSRCTLSIGNGAAFIELWSQERVLKFTRKRQFRVVTIAFDRRMTDREDESPHAARRSVFAIRCVQESSLPGSHGTSFRAISSDRGWRPSGCAAQGRKPNSSLHGRMLPAFDTARHAETERRLPRRLPSPSFIRYATVRTKEAAIIVIARSVHTSGREDLFFLSRASPRGASSSGSVSEIRNSLRFHRGIIAIASTIVACILHADSNVTDEGIRLDRNGMK